MLSRYFCVWAYAHLCLGTPLVEWLGRGLSRMNLHMSACVSFLPFMFTGMVVALAVSVLLVVFQTLEREARIPVVHCIDFHLIPLFLKQDPEHQLSQIPELLWFILSRKSKASPVKHPVFNPSLILNSHSYVLLAELAGVPLTSQGWTGTVSSWAYSIDELVFFFYRLFSQATVSIFSALPNQTSHLFFIFWDIEISLCYWNSSLFFFLVNLCRLFLYSHLEGFLEEEILTHTQSALFKDFLSFNTM